MLTFVSPKGQIVPSLVYGLRGCEKYLGIVLKAVHFLQSDIPSALISRVRTSRVFDLCVFSVLLFCYDHSNGPRLELGGKEFLSLMTLDVHGVSAGSVQLRSRSDSLYYIPLSCLLYLYWADWPCTVFMAE